MAEANCHAAAADFGVRAVSVVTTRSYAVTQVAHSVVPLADSFAS